jgi:hypothetical protein
MNTFTASMANESVITGGLDLPGLNWLRIIFTSFLLLTPVVLIPSVIQGQSTATADPAESPYVVEGESDTMAYAVGRSLRINGTVKNGAIALGGDVIVAGIVEGDVAAVGGSVIQLEGSRINGEVMVVGGTYRPVDKVPSRGPGAQTFIYSGYEQQLRNIIRNPKELLAPRWSAAYFGFRLLAILFWFIVSLALTAAMPGTISRGIARLQLSRLRVGIIGFCGALVIGVVVPFSLHYLPSPVNVLVGLMALLLILIAGLFGRVIIYAATGRWLQRKFFRVGKNSEAVALLLGTTFWITLSSLPYVWPFIVAMVLVTSLGLALTARYRVGWRAADRKTS